MNFASHTPESLLPRSDSKNPATTCKGITSTGRACRRSLGSSPKSSPGPSPSKDRGVIAVLRDGHTDGNAAAAFYCWQHKDQAEKVAQTEQNHTELFPLQERTSIDTLVDRVGVMNLDDATGSKATRQNRRQKQAGETTERQSLPADWRRMQGPLMSVPSDMVSHAPAAKAPRQSGPPRSNVKASLFCCVRDVGDDDHLPPYRRRHHAENSVPNRVIASGENRHADGSRPIGKASRQTPSPISRKPLASTPNRATAVPPGPRTPNTPTRPTLATTPQSTGSQTQTLLSLIPAHLSPQTTSVLLSELSKPISPADAEGYIYMFWLTPESEASKPDDEAASDLLEPPSTRPTHARQSSDVLQRYASVRRGPKQTRTILLKIGRAENVHRRLSQWAKQCSHNITLIRYYPYASSSNHPHSSGSAQAQLPRKVPHVHRVERLIHVELAEKRVAEQGACENCGREHREWFEIEASRDGLRAVDEVIRRWVGWAERQE